MVGKDLRAEADRIPCGDGRVSPDLQRQFVIVGHVAHTGVLHGVIHLVDRRVDRVHGDRSDRHVRRLVLVGRHISAAMAQSDLHIEGRVGAEGADVQLGVEDLNFSVRLDVAGSHFPFAGGVDENGLGALAMQSCDDLLDIQNDLSDVFLDAGDRGKLVLDACDLDGGRSRAGQRGQKHSSEAVAEGRTIAPFERLHDILTVGAVLGRIDTLNARLFNFYHEYKYPPYTTKRCFAAEFSLPINEGQTLLGVQLDDQIFCDLKVNVVLGRKCNNLARKGVLISVQPLRSGDERIVLFHGLEAGGGAALLADGDDVAHIHLIGGDVDALAVDGEVAVVDELTSLAAGLGKAQTINRVVQSALDQAQKVLTGVAAHALCLFVEHTELLLQDAIDELDLLLFGQLRAIFRLLRSSLAAGVAVGILAVTHRGRRHTKRSAALENRLCILCHLTLLLLVSLNATALGRTAAIVRNGSYVLDHRDLQASGLERTDGGFTALTGALDVDFYALEAAVFHSSLCSGLSDHLRGVGSGLSAAAESEAAGGSPGQCVAIGVGDGHHGVIEGRADMHGALFNYLALTTALDYFLNSLCHLHIPPYFFLFAMVFFGPLRVRALVLVL